MSRQKKECTVRRTLVCKLIMEAVCYLFPGKRCRKGKPQLVSVLKLTNTASKNNKGFTLLEMLLVLLIFISVAAMFPLFYQTIYQVDKEMRPESRAEWELFIIQLHKELGASHAWDPKQQKLFYEQEGISISVEKYQSSVRRRVNGSGHEVMLQGIKDIQFRWEEGSLVAEAAFLEGEKKRAYFFPLGEEQK